MLNSTRNTYTIIEKEVSVLYKSEKSGLTVYETFDELLNADIVDMFLFEDNYYIKLRPENIYDECVWKVNGKTNEISTIHYIETFMIRDKAETIDPKTLRKGA